MENTLARELKPCPFCGGDDLRVAYLRACDECRFWRVECANEACDASTLGPSADTEEKAIAAWNTRLSLEGEVERLRELVFESLYHLRCDARAEAYHIKATAALAPSRDRDNG